MTVYAVHHRNVTGNSYITQVLVLIHQSTCNLGVILDSKLSFKKHISELRRSSFFHLKRIKSVKPFIPHGMLETLIHAFVTSRVDWCNSLFFGAYPIPPSQKFKLCILHVPNFSLEEKDLTRPQKSLKSYTGFLLNTESSIKC